MIKTKTGIFYKVPEDMFPFAANNLVANGLADWVERVEPKLSTKLKETIDKARAAMRFPEASTPKRSTQVAMLSKGPKRQITIVDTGAKDFGNLDLGLDFSVIG
jgi:hypothetical protein